MSTPLGQFGGYDVEVRDTPSGPVIEISNPCDANGVSMYVSDFASLVSAWQAWENR